MEIVIDQDKTAQALTDATLFHHQIHALTLIDREVNLYGEGAQHDDDSEVYYRARGRCYSCGQELKLLNGLALLLVQNPGDVVAVSTKLTPSGFVFYWARNDNLESDSEKDYIERILRLALQPGTLVKIRTEVVKHTKKNIVSRCQKLAKACEVGPQSPWNHCSNVMSIKESRRGSEDLEQECKDKGIFEQDGSLIAHVDGLVKRIAFATLDSSDFDLSMIILGAYELCNVVKGLDSVVKWPDRMRKLRNLAEYVDTTRQLRRQARKIWRRGYRRYELQQVLAEQEPHEATVQGPLIDSLNRWAEAKHDLPPIQDYQQVRWAFRKADCGPDGMVSIPRCQHAELTLALHLIIAPLTAGTESRICIGVSKPSCYWCHIWLDLLNVRLARKKITLIVEADHSKRTDGWILPHDRSVERQFLRKLGMQMQSFYDFCIEANPPQWFLDEAAKPPWSEDNWGPSPEPLDMETFLLLENDVFGGKEKIFD